MTNIPEVPSTRAEQARAVANEVRTSIEAIKGFGFLSPGETRRLAPSASVPDEFLDVIARAMESRPSLAASAQASPEALRIAVVDSQALLGLAAELDRLARGCRDTVRRIRAQAGTESLRVYAISQKFVRPRDTDDNATWVDQMKLALGRRGKKKPDEEAAKRKAAKKQEVEREVLPSATPDFKAGKDL